MTMSTTSSTASAMLMAWRAGRMIEAPLMRPDSFEKAITEPVKVMAPMATPSDISTRLAPWIAPTTPMPNAVRAYRAAAPPPPPEAAAEPHAEHHQGPGAGTRRRMRRERGHDRDRHADHAEQI